MNSFEKLCVIYYIIQMSTGCIMLLNRRYSEQSFRNSESYLLIQRNTLIIYKI